MSKLTAFAAFLVVALLWPPKSNADVGICGYLSKNSTVTAAENYIIAAAEAIVKYNLDGKKVGEEIAYEVVNKCPQYVGIVLQATDNLGG